MLHVHTYRFVDYRDESICVDIRPRTGSVLLFEHNLLHEGAILREGRKYAIQTDVMYTEKGAGNMMNVRSMFGDMSSGKKPRPKSKAHNAESNPETKKTTTIAGDSPAREPRGQRRLGGWRRVVNTGASSFL